MNERIETLKTTINAMKVIVNSRYYDISDSNVGNLIDYRNSLKKELMTLKTIQQLREERTLKLNEIKTNNI